MMNNKKIKSLYVHIPFCAHICKYCDFTKLFYNRKFSEPYLEALFSELDSYNIDKVDTIYVGGGTPTALSNEELLKLLNKLKTYAHNDTEFTVEGNVENLTIDKINILKQCGVNRVSVGIESTNDNMLKAIGRNHTYKQVVEVVDLLKQSFNNINVDLIYGFPHQSLNELKTDLENIIKLGTDHISIYSLIVSPNTKYYNEGVKEQDEDSSRLYYDFILQTLRKKGYERYEVSNFARNGHYSRHNLTYWHDEEYYGVGLGASGYVSGVRYTNTKNIEQYIKGNYVDVKEELDFKEQLEDFLLCNLRLEQGFNKADFEARFGMSFERMFIEKLPELVSNQLIKITKDRVMLTDEGLVTMDRVLLKLI